MSFMQMFENATGIDVPDQIAGVDIPKIDLEDVAQVAGNALGGEIGEKLSDVAELLDKATKVREVIACTKRTAGDCFGIVDRAQDVYDSISTNIEPFEPLLKFDVVHMPQAMAQFNKEGLDACIKIMGDVLGLSKLMEKISNILAAVKSIFETVMDACGDIVDQVKEFFSDVADAMAEALGLESALGGIQDLYDGLKGVITEITDISGTLTPCLEAWENANFIEGMAFGATHFSEVKDAFQRFWPAWEMSLEQYAKSQVISSDSFERAKDIYNKYKQVVAQLCKFTGMEVPGGHDACDEMAMPRCVPRGGFQIEEPFVPIE